jgi:hypothetical protein
MKTCSKCNADKPESEFYTYTSRDKHLTGGLHARCKRCEHDARASHRKANPQKAADNARKCKLKKVYGISVEQWEQMSVSQNGVCAICKGKSKDGRRLHVDHCHASGKVRGLLCHDCNRGLGMFQDNTIFLQNAKEYLDNHSQLD